LSDRRWEVCAVVRGEGASCGFVQNCSVDLRLPAALRRGSVCQNFSRQHISGTYVGESVGGHLDGVGCVAG
jgi:hypothetical protein